jgi:hypothetical protein
MSSCHEAGVSGGRTVARLWNAIEWTEKGMVVHLEFLEGIGI